MAPYELQTLHGLRKRGQCPKLPVFVTDRWDWSRKLADFGGLCVRLQSPSDLDHDWSALAGLHCMLLCHGELMRMGSRYEALSWKLLEARPSQFELFFQEKVYGRSEPCFSTLVIGVQEPIDKIIQRDALLYRLLRH